MSLTPPARPARHSGKQKLALITLVLLVLGTFFLLPSLVPERRLDDAREPCDVGAGGAGTSPELAASAAPPNVSSVRVPASASPGR